MLDGVGEQIDEDLLQPTAIGLDQDPARGAPRSGSSGPSAALGDFDGISHDLNEIDRHDHELESTGLDAAHVEEAPDEFSDLPGLHKRPSRVGTGLRRCLGAEVPVDELEVTREGRRLGS